jgi:hypothetical protein
VLANFFQFIDSIEKSDRAKKNGGSLQLTVVPINKLSILY